MTWLLALAALAGAQAPEADPRFDRYLTPGRLVEIAPGRRLNLRCEGRGGPTIILEAGLGFPSLSWRVVQPRLAQIARTCSYDRAGLGFSDPGPLPRSAEAIADDLEALLRRAGLPPPYVFVASSMGGQIARLFAFRHPHRVAGLVLLDPYVEGQYPALTAIEPGLEAELREGEREERGCVEALRQGNLPSEEAERRGCIAGPNATFSQPLNALLRQQRLRPQSFEAAYSESRMLDTVNEAQLARARRHLGSIPIIVLSAAGNYASPRFDRTRAALLAEQAALHARLAAFSDRGEVRSVQAGHVVQIDNPETVVAAVRAVIERVTR